MAAYPFHSGPPFVLRLTLSILAFYAILYHKQVLSFIFNLLNIEGCFMKTGQLRVFLAEAGTLAISAIGFIGMKIPYSSPTDVLLALAIGGNDGYGAPQYLCSIHMNTLLNYLLYLLQRLTGIFNIFGLTLIALFTLSFCLLQLTASERHPVTHLLIAVMQVLCLTHFTYTVVAYIAMGAGILCLAAGHRSPARGLCCWFLMLTGASLRHNVIISAVALLLPILISRLLPVRSVTDSDLNRTDSHLNGTDRHLKRTDRHLNKSRACSLLRMYAAALLLWFLIGSVINPVMYRIHGNVWENYYSYHEQSLRIRDEQVIDHDKYRAVMDQVGWSENDLKMARSWMFTDSDVFSAEKLKTAADAVELTDRLDLNPADLIRRLFMTPMAVGFLVVSCIALVFAFRRIRRMNSVGSSYTAASFRYALCVLLPAALIPCMMWTALYVRQRFVDRVAIPFLVLGILQFTELFEAFLYFDSQNTEPPADNQSASRSSAVLIAVALSFCIVAAGQIRNINENVFRSTGGNASLSTDETASLSEERQLFRQYLEEHRDTVFLTVPGVLNRMTANIPVVEVSGESAYENVVRTASQLSFSENYYDQCWRLTIEDPDHLLKNLIAPDRPVLLLATGKREAETIRVYLKEHYGYTGKYTALEDIMPGITVYQY